LGYSGSRQEKGVKLRLDKSVSKGGLSSEKLPLCIPKKSCTAKKFGKLLQTGSKIVFSRVHQ
jgi:hypothetical protein